MNRKIFSIAVFSLFLDQLSKVLISVFLNVGEEISVIQNFFSIHYIENYGVAWSLFSNHVGWIIAINLVALFIIGRYMYSFKKTTRNNIAFGLILGGICGNLIDRVFLGYVRDFLSFKILNYDYPIFNFADIWIVISVFLLVIAILKGEDKNGKIQSIDK